MIRFLYNLVWPLGLLLFLPGYLLKMFRRGGYRENFGQRLGLYDSAVRKRLAGKKPIWIHAVSVGEVAIALKLARGLRQRKPERPLVLTTTTTTGYALARSQFESLGEVLYMPLDFWPIMHRGFNLIDPAAILLVEAEVWPNLMAEARRRNTPVALVNARLSPRSYSRFRRFRRFVSPLFRQLAFVSVAEPQDTDRWRTLGVEDGKIQVVGSVKFDSTELEAAVKRVSQASSAHDDSRPTLLGGSTHHGEEEILAEVLIKVRKRFPSLGLFLAPRHVERVRDIRKKLESRGLTVLLVSEAANASVLNPDCMLLDRTGELQKWYAGATVAFVGKSLIAHGGQNPVEPVVAGVPVVFGPNMENFAAIARELVAKNGAIEVRNPLELEATVTRLLAEPQARQSLVANASAVIARHRGATERTAALIEKLL